MFAKIKRRTNFFVCVFIFVLNSVFERGDFMLTQNIQIAEISAEEYDFIIDCIDFSEGQVKGGARFLIYNRQKKLIDIVKNVMRNELNENERDIATAHWCNEVPVGELAQQYGVTRMTIYRNLDNARKKLEASLKYVLMYDKILIPQSTEEILEYVRKYEN